MRPASSAGRRARTRVLSWSLSLATIVATVGPIVDPSMAVAQKSSKSANVRCTSIFRVSTLSTPAPSTSFEGHRSLKRQSGAGEREQSPWRAIPLGPVAEEIHRLPCPKHKPPPKRIWCSAIRDSLFASDILSRWARLLLENPLHYACANAKLPADFEDPVTASLQF